MTSWKGNKFQLTTPFTPTTPHCVFPAPLFPLELFWPSQAALCRLVTDGSCPVETQLITPTWGFPPSRLGLHSQYVGLPGVFRGGLALARFFFFIYFYSNSHSDSSFSYYHGCFSYTLQVFISPQFPSSPLASMILYAPNDLIHLQNFSCYYFLMFSPG